MEAFQQILGPIILFLLMIVVGLQLVPDDFRRVAAAPRAVVGGTIAQVALLPLMTWVVVAGLALSPIFGAGAVLLAATPGAGMSNVMAAVSRANVALSVTLTAVSSLLAVVTMPTLAALGIRTFIGDSVDIEIPVGPLVGQLVVFLGCPIGVGMIVRARRPESAQNFVAMANRTAVVAVLVLTVLGALASESSLPSGAEFAWALLASVAWTLFAMLIGWSAAVLLGLDGDERFTFLIEFSARNIALTFIIAVASLGRLDLGFFAAAYSMTGFPLVILLSVLRGRLRGQPAVGVAQS